MKGRWVRKGLITSIGATEYTTAHMQVPTPLLMEDRIRLYYAGRHQDGRSYLSYLDVSRENPSDILRLSTEQIMPFGAPGNFDSDGIMPGSVVRYANEILMYYTGWNEKTRTARYHNAVGLAVSLDHGRTFKQEFPGPVVDRTRLLPGVAVTPDVMQPLTPGGAWRMWYASGVKWIQSPAGGYEPVYIIRYATSPDGRAWHTHLRPCVPQTHPDEAQANPSVLFRDGVYHMWYCYRGSEDYRDGKDAYRIGYAYSQDNGVGRNFIRADDVAGLNPSEDPTAWDGKMTAYPKVLELDGRLIMFYNGNSFGQTGIGWAEWEDA